MKKIRGLRKGANKLIPIVGPIPPDIQVPGVLNNDEKLARLREMMEKAKAKAQDGALVTCGVQLPPPALPQLLPGPAAPLALPPGQPAAKTKLPKSFVDGVIGAGLGHAADSLLGSIGSKTAQGVGMGSLLLGALGKMLAPEIKKTNPEAAATLDAMANGAMVGAAFKAAAKAAEDARPLPLVEEARLAVEAMNAQEKKP